eukprot:256240_1
MAFVLEFLGLLMSLSSSQMIVTPPSWPIYWSGFYIQVDTLNPSDLQTAGGWWSDFRNYPQKTGLLRQDLDLGCDGGGFEGSCRGIFKNNNFYQYAPDKNLCCLAIPDLAPTPPNWLVNRSTSIGNSMYQWTGIPSQGWIFESSKLEPPHTYYSDLSNGLPVAERGGAPGSATDLIWYSVSTSRYNESVFYLPNHCEKPCFENTGKYIILEKIKNR